MKEITIIIPIHKLDEKHITYFENSLKSVNENINIYEKGKLQLLIVGPKSISTTINEYVNKSGIDKSLYKFVVNKGKTDFFTQIELGVNSVKTEYFSILEYDDSYTKNWFVNVNKYMQGNDNLSMIMPICAEFNIKGGSRFTNAIAWATAFSDRVGYIDSESLKVYNDFIYTGSVFNKKDYINAGGLDCHFKLFSGYNLMVHISLSKLNNIYVVPKIGYIHNVGLEGSIMEDYKQNLPEDVAEGYYKEVLKSFDDNQK